VPNDTLIATVERLDRRIVETMWRLSLPTLRIALAVVYGWFGILKPLGLSPAAPLVLATVQWMPLFTPVTWLGVIGWWEVVIGVTFLWRRTTRVAIALLALQMGGTLLPLIILPEVTFQTGRWPYAPTVEGQYIIKNLLIIAAAITLGGRVRAVDRAESDVHSQSRRRDPGDA
jgi:uncharacterized membrane protein YkgB